MLSKAKIKFIKSLQIKKYRKQEQCFIVQGAKSVQELLHSDFRVITVLGTPEFLLTLNIFSDIEKLEVTERELNDLSEYQSNDTALAVAELKPNKPLHLLPNEFGLILDDIRDPGNFGTIIRTADWYGINKIVVSTETADFYNPKVISASMGSFTRVDVFYTDLSPYLESKQVKVYGTFLEGEDIHNLSFNNGGFIMVGNESKGISTELEKFVTQKITIPRYGQAESLNAAIATAIVCDNIRRKKN